MRILAMLLISLLSFAVAASASAKSSPEQQCKIRKVAAHAKLAACLGRLHLKRAQGRAVNDSTCTRRFESMVSRADRAAARKAVSCRWLSNGNGTATDLDTGLTWELKTDDGGIHDLDNTYSWGDNTYSWGDSAGAPDGTAFVDFLGTLNAGVSEDGEAPAGCFSGHCDWRLPSIVELTNIVDTTVEGCETGNGCSNIPGLTKNAHYWSGTSKNGEPSQAWLVRFINGDTDHLYKGNSFCVRAVRKSAIHELFLSDQ